MFQLVHVSSCFALVIACGAPSERAQEPEAASEVESTPNESSVEPENPPPPVATHANVWAAGPITNDEQAVRAAERAFHEAVAPQLRPERSATAESWERNLAAADRGHVTRAPCAELAARLRDSIVALGTPDSAEQQILFGSVENLSSGECVTVHVGVGFETLITALRPTDGRLLLTWDVPEG